MAAGKGLKTGPRARSLDSSLARRNAGSRRTSTKSRMPTRPPAARKPAGRPAARRLSGRREVIHLEVELDRKLASIVKREAKRQGISGEDLLVNALRLVLATLSLALGKP